MPPGLPFKGQRSPFLLILVSWLRSPLGLESAAAQQYSALGTVVRTRGLGSQCLRVGGNRSLSAAPPSPGRPATLRERGSSGQEAPGFFPVGGQRDLNVPNFPTSEGGRLRRAQPHGCA